MSSDVKTRPVYLAKIREAPQQRAHFALFIPNSAHLESDPNDRSQSCLGTLINVVGAPMAGFCHEFRRNYSTIANRSLQPLVYLGSIDSSHVTDPQDTKESIDSTATGTLDTLALQLRPPSVSHNFMAPVNDTTNRRCQEWTMEYLHLLVSKGYISESAVSTAQRERDPPDHGIGLRPFSHPGN